MDWDCADDRAALATAAGYRIDHGAELWSGDRKVAALGGGADATADRQVAS